jgi:hypothetical protein
MLSQYARLFHFILFLYKYKQLHKPLNIDKYV